LVAYQGILGDRAGKPVPDASRNITFRIYDALEGGNELWKETQTVSTQKGLFNVLLGSTTPFGANVFASSPRYLGVQVEGESEMTPRLPLASVPFALRAADADTLGGLSATSFALSSQSCPQGMVVTGIDASGKLVCASAAVVGLTATPTPTATGTPTPPRLTPTPTPTATATPRLTPTPTPTGAVVTFVRKWGSQGSADARFDNPVAIDVDTAGYICVADTGNHRVQVFR